MALARVDDEHAGAPRRIEDLLRRRNGAAQMRHVIAEDGAEAAGLDEVALHVDDDER